jgi:PAS domain S-box-containing protein
MSLTTPAAVGAPEVFPGDSEMAALMRTVDWASTPVGPPEDWPQSLRTSVSICLLSRFPIILWWGPRHVMLYNDAYSQIIAEKHPLAMGLEGRRCFPEIWEIIGPMLRGVLERGEATWSEDQLLFLRRHGFTEECYFTFSYSPIRDESGGTGGIFCAVTETTPKILRERRLALLRELGIKASDAAEASRQVLATLADHPADIPYARFHPEPAIPPALAGIRDLRVLDLAPNDAPGSDPWGDAPLRAAAIEVERAGGDGRWGVLELGLAPRLAFDAEYEDLVRLVGGAMATAMTAAESLASERRRAEALAELDRAKTAFFTNISHEFRTPLTLLLGPLDELERDESVADAARNRVELARRNARRLYRLVNALLEFSRIEAGRIQASYEPVDLAALTSQLASMFRSAFDGAGVRLGLDVEPMPEPAFVDREMWERIVLNLVSNAFKHTYEGEVRVALRAADGQAVLTVTDTGVGIPAAELPRIFERFHRVERRSARTHEGSGIGLALVHELVKLHGGRIEAFSEVDRGSRFVVHIPLGRDHLPPERVTEEPTRSGDAAIARAFVDEALGWLPARPSQSEAAAVAVDHLRVLVVDDNADMRRYVTSILERDYEVEVAADGLEALERIRSRPPALVLADVMMPKLDGFGLASQLRLAPETRTLPIILLSARAGEEAAIEGLAKGADDYLVKPFGAGDLRARVAAHLATARLRELATRELQAAEAKFRSLVEHNPSGISLLDARGDLTYSNPTWLTYLGGGVDELRGWGWTRVIHPDDVEALSARIRAAFEHEAATSVEFRARRHDGAYRWFAGTVTPVRDATGSVGSWIAVSVDIDDRVRAEQALHEALARLTANETELRRALAAKDEFLSMVSHELRTPLTTILGNARVLRSRPNGFDAQVRDGALADIADEAERLNQIIANLLVLARLEAGRSLDLEPLLVGHVVRAIVEEERQGQPGREVRVEGCDTRAVAIGNPDAFGQVLTNLLSNATKYSPPSAPIEVRCEVEGGAVAIIVADRGVGIAADEAERIFEPFYRSGRTIATSGMGIGLSVCRRLMEAVGGTLEAAPRNGGGACFTVRLPLAVDAEEPLEGATLTDPAPAT